jgi:ABC-type phosphate transport system auxiliary subunit
MNISAWLSVVIVVLVIVLIIFAVSVTSKLSKRLLFLHKHISDSVQSKFIELNPTTQSLVEAAVEVWRLEKRVKKISGDLSEDQNKAFENSMTKLKRFLDKNDITFADYTDQKYNDGLNLDVLSIDKDTTATESVIKETHEPAVFHKGQLIKNAKVVVLEK